ncbi:MAG: hypothetical protein ACKO9I_08080 [Sphaerospermopsis kisseleviana]|uniref:Uncharacterized protein n=1 Tax=Sphaerospermopsis kisseleviana CS-549 TaxID=3021783 RepID=A0ABT4ZXV1_9CYAN|nr:MULTISPECIES: hypothetical protein [Sphaerospermopsis]MDB9443906.1 hypothetical protein [Sphaerospermopsis kisseleviana CS-549]MEB3151317.1 hypothetical protein [Sphaerospermopsis sp.]
MTLVIYFSHLLNIVFNIKSSDRTQYLQWRSLFQHHKTHDCN